MVSFVGKEEYKPVKRWNRIARLFLVLAGVGVFAFVLLISFLNSSLSGIRSYREVDIPSQGYSIHGFLSPATEPGDLWVIMVHGNRKDGQSHLLYRMIFNNLTEEVSILAIDLRGFGSSEDVNLAQAERILDRSEDIEAAVDFLMGEYGVTDDRIVLLGHSLGAVQVMRVAQRHPYRLSIPIGIGDWDDLLGDTKKIQDYIGKFAENSGIELSEAKLIEEGSGFTASELFSECPQTSSWLIFGSLEEGRAAHQQNYTEARNRCGASVRWSVIPLADHMFGTELTKLPKLAQSTYQRLELSLLLRRLNDIMEEASH